jgi:cytochrome c nitrite reductase small subunit
MCSDKLMPVSGHFGSMMKTIVLKKWWIIATMAVGMLTGLGGYTFFYAEGLSYLSVDPRACANCHIMQPQLDSWQKSSHKNVAVCANCHLPQDFVAKYIAKAENGYHHSMGFTLQNFHEPIMIKAKNAQILQDNCLSCHGDLVLEMVMGATKDPNAVRCVHCHADVGHGPTAGLGAPADY